jgi:PAS domain S-box-containing protein
MESLKRLFSPPHLGSHDTEQRILILRVSSVSTLVFGLVLGLINVRYGFLNLAFFLFLMAGVSAYTLWSIRGSRLLIPSILLPLSVLLVLTSNLLTGGILQEPGALVYPIVIVFASLLLGKWAALVFAVLSILSQSLVFYAFRSGWVSGIQGNISGLLIVDLLIAVLAGLLWIVLDSLERSVDQARTSEERWRSLVENAPVTIVNTDTIGRIRFINRTDDGDITEVIGKPLLNYVRSNDYKRAAVNTRRVLASGKSTYFESVGHNLDGEEVYYSVSVGPIFGPDSKVEGLTFIILDITEKRRVEDQIRRLNAELEMLVRERTAQLETSNQELASFSYSISHNLRTPLRAIDGFSLALLEDYEEVLDEQGQDYLIRVRAASQHMGVLIDALLRLAAVARQKVQREPVDLSALADSVVQELQTADPDHKVEFQIELGLKAWGDENLLHAALSNLFGNAWKFSRGSNPPKIEFGCSSCDEMSTFFVRDNGIGFDMQYADKLFQPFQHLHSSRVFQGAGIGLAIVQRIIQKHGGHIWAEAQENEGATFYFTLASF